MYRGRVQQGKDINTAVETFDETIPGNCNKTLFCTDSEKRQDFYPGKIASYYFDIDIIPAKGCLLMAGSKQQFSLCPKYTHTSLILYILAPSPKT